MPSLSNFPVNLLEEIFTRLAVKTLIILTSVCKPWLALISSQSFVQLHLSRSHLDPNNHLLLFHNPWHKSIMISPINCSRIPTITLIPASRTPNLTNRSIFNLISPSMGTFVGSINGLVCFSRPARWSNNVVIWNPATHRFKDISMPILKIDQKFTILVAFGFNYAVGDYKIVCVYTPCPLTYNRSCHFRMYSCSDNSWKELKPDSPLNLHFVSDCVNVKGNPYWKCLCKQMNEIWVKVNVQTEAIQMFSGLEYVKNEITSASIMALGNSLAHAVFLPGAESNNLVHVYTLEEHSGVWNRMYTFGLIGLERRVRLMCYKNDKIIFTKGYSNKLVMYDIKSNEIKELMVDERCPMYQVPFNYIESLAAIEGMESDRILQ